MSVFLTKIQVNKIFHLEDILIEIDSQEKKHLILTGKNGSGKTSLLNSIADFLQSMTTSVGWDYLTRLTEKDSAVILDFNTFDRLAKKIQNNDLLLSFYSATRKTEVIIPQTPEKPNLGPVIGIRHTKIGEFIKFLVDLKIQEALARNEHQIEAANEIKNWFENFTSLLQQIFEGDEIRLIFNYKDYSFTIEQGQRKFGFNELSDGYSAIIDIIADLIIKMQNQNSLTRAYEKEGIVLIDEVETHLHLKLQRLILPMLTQIFPNIQFIVTTHSPFVLSSLDNAVAFDLERKMRLEDLTEYSYEALAEGYFNVETGSNFLMTKLERFEKLSQIPQKDAAENAEYESLDQEFASMDETLIPQNVKGQYSLIKLKAK